MSGSAGATALSGINRCRTDYSIHPQFIDVPSDQWPDVFKLPVAEVVGQIGVENAGFVGDRVEGQFVGHLKCPAMRPIRVAVSLVHKGMVIPPAGPAFFPITYRPRSAFRGFYGAM